MPRRVLYNCVQVTTNRIPERKCLMVHLQTVLSVSYKDIPWHFCSTLCNRDVGKKKKSVDFKFRSNKKV